MKAKHRPPTPKEPKRYVAPGFTALGLSSAALGDLVESALVEQLNLRALVGTAAGKARQGAFDMEMPDGVWVEVKAMTVFAKEYKVKPTRHSMEQKMAWAEAHGRETGTLAVIVDERGRGRCYFRAGLGCYRLGLSGLNWTYIGKVKVEL